MLRAITTPQLLEWRAYSDLEPWDEERADLRAAQVVQAIRNAWRGKGGRSYTLKECVLRFTPAKARTPEQARAETRRTLEMLMLIHNQQATTSAGKGKGKGRR